MAHACTRFLVFPKPASDAQQILIFANVFRSATAAKKDACVLFRLDVFEGDIGINGIPFPLLGNRPARLDFMQHHLITPLLRSCHNWLVAPLNQPIVGIQSVDCFCGIADND